MKKNKNVNFIKYFLFLFIILSCLTTNVYAASCDDKNNISERLSCLKKKYDDLPFSQQTSNCNIDKQKCEKNSSCVYLDKDNVDYISNSCGIIQNSTIGYTCRYAGDLGGSTGVYIELNMSGAWFDSGYFYTSGNAYVGYRDKIVFADGIEAPGDGYYKNGELHGLLWFCPSKIYYESSEKKDSKGNYFERKIFTESGAGRTEVKLLIENANDINSTYNYIMAIEPNESLITPKDPLTCEYNNITAGAVRDISVTYVNENTVTAQYLDDTGLVKQYDVSAILDSPEFYNWECANEGNVFAQIVDKDGKLVLHVAYDKNLLPDPDSAHDFSPSGDNGNDSDKDKTPPNYDPTACGIFTQELVDMITDALDLIKIAGPILALVLGTIDFIKAMTSGDSEKELKTAFTRFSKRLVAAIILFLLPIILAFLLDIFLKGQPGYNPDNPYCGVVDWGD